MHLFNGKERMILCDAVLPKRQDDDTQNVVRLILLYSLRFYNIQVHQHNLIRPATAHRLVFLRFTCCPLSVSLTSNVRIQCTDLTANPFVQERNSFQWCQ